MQPRDISEKEAAFNAQIVAAFRAGQSVPDIVRVFRCQSTVVGRILRAAGLLPSSESQTRWR